MRPEARAWWPSAGLRHDPAGERAPLAVELITHGHQRSDSPVAAMLRPGLAAAQRRRMPTSLPHCKCETKHHFIGVGSQKYNFPFFSPTGYDQSMVVELPSLFFLGPYTIFSSLMAVKFSRLVTLNSSQSRPNPANRGSIFFVQPSFNRTTLEPGFSSVTTTFVVATARLYCCVPSFLIRSDTLSQQVMDTKSSALCFSNACLAAATNFASSSW